MRRDSKKRAVLHVFDQISKNWKRGLSAQQIEIMMGFIYLLGGDMNVYVLSPYVRWSEGMVYGYTLGT